MTEKYQPEKGQPQEDTPSFPYGLEYPRALVDRYGAKAGILLHVGQYLPDIPLARMLVSEPGESATSFAQRVIEEDLRMPLLIRSSAVAELAGYEGAFSTVEVKPGNNLEREIDYVQTSPKWLKERGDVGDEVPDWINVIAAEKTISSHVGTYIKHPNQLDTYLMSITEARSLVPFDQGGRFTGALRFAYRYTPQEGVQYLERFTNFISHDLRHHYLEDQLALIASWHDRISNLPEMDPRWAYQIEFGIDPACLFQVRPFKPYEIADFTINDDEEFRWKPIVIGITPPEGIVARVVSIDEMLHNKELPANETIVIIDKMREARRIPRLTNHQANLFDESFGFLQHEDIAAMRQARVTALYPIFLHRHHPGELLRITSDGKNIKVENINNNPEDTSHKPTGRRIPIRRTKPE